TTLGKQQRSRNAHPYKILYATFHNASLVNVIFFGPTAYHRFLFDITSNSTDSAPRPSRNSFRDFRIATFESVPLAPEKNDVKCLIVRAGSGVHLRCRLVKKFTGQPCNQKSYQQPPFYIMFDLTKL